MEMLSDPALLSSPLISCGSSQLGPGSVQWRDYRSGEPRDLVSRLDWSARGPGAGRGCLQGGGVNIMTGAVGLMDDDDTDTAPDVDTGCCVAAS